MIACFFPHLNLLSCCPAGDVGQTVSVFLDRSKYRGIDGQAGTNDLLLYTGVPPSTDMSTAGNAVVGAAAP
eukprot:357152-Chlamydomonas_euryale.AAC.8